MLRRAAQPDRLQRAIRKIHQRRIVPAALQYRDARLQPLFDLIELSVGNPHTGDFRQAVLAKRLHLVLIFRIIRTVDVPSLTAIGCAQKAAEIESKS